jgi:hypothetical protein
MLNICIVYSLIILCCTLYQSQAHPCPHPRVQESEITTQSASQKLVEVLVSLGQISSNLVTISCLQPQDSFTMNNAHTNLDHSVEESYIEIWSEFEIESWALISFTRGNCSTSLMCELKNQRVISHLCSHQLDQGTDTFHQTAAQELRECQASTRQIKCNIVSVSVQQPLNLCSIILDFHSFSLVNIPFYCSWNSTASKFAATFILLQTPSHSFGTEAMRVKPRVMLCLCTHTPIIRVWDVSCSWGASVVVCEWSCYAPVERIWVLWLTMNLSLNWVIDSSWGCLTC